MRTFRHPQLRSAIRSAIIASTTASIVSLLAACGNEMPIEQEFENEHTIDAVRILIEPSVGAGYLELNPLPLTALTYDDIYDKDAAPTTTWITEKKLVEIPQDESNRLMAVAIGTTIINLPPEDLYLQLDENGAPHPNGITGSEPQELECGPPFAQIDLIADELSPDTSISKLWVAGRYIDVGAGRVNFFAEVCQSGIVATEPALWVDETQELYGLIPRGDLYGHGEFSSYSLSTPLRMATSTISANLGLEFETANASLQHILPRGSERFSLLSTITRSGDPTIIEMPFLPEEKANQALIEYSIQFNSSTIIERPFGGGYSELFPANADNNSLLTASRTNILSERQLNGSFEFEFPNNPFADPYSGHGFIFLSNPDGNVRGDMVMIKVNVNNATHARNHEDISEFTILSPLNHEYGQLEIDSFDLLRALPFIGGDFEVTSFSIVDYDHVVGYENALTHWWTGDTDYSTYTITAAE